MQRVYFLILICLIQGLFGQSDKDATPAAKNLFSKLKALTTMEKFIFGQEMPTTFSHSGFKTNLDQSDCKDVVGDHPGLFGFDFHYILYKSAGEADTQKRAIAKAIADGAVITWNFHMYDNSGSTFNSRDSNRDLVKKIINSNDNSGSRRWYFGVMDQIIQIIKAYNQGMIYRPLHEMNGNWFWWGNQNPADYIALFRQTVDYIRGKGVHNLLVAWTPNAPGGNLKFWEYYPGHAYVDIVGADIYEPGITSPSAQFVQLTASLTKFAENNGKIGALTEVGTRDGNSILNRPRFWTENVLNPIMNDKQANKIAYLQTWINSNWEKPYIPHSGMSGAAVDDFKKFYSSPTTLFLKETAAFMAGNALPAEKAREPSSPSENKGGDCSDVPPPDSVHSCAQQKDWGKCGADWMRGYCRSTCGTCNSANPPANNGGCNDVVPPGSSHSCAQQKAWGKCSESWMNGFCRSTCGTCNSAANNGRCNDVMPPGSSHSCAQQKAWGKCDADWMNGFCQITCGKCSRAVADNSQTFSETGSSTSSNAVVAAVVVCGIIVVAGLVAIIIALASKSREQVERP